MGSDAGASDDSEQMAFQKAYRLPRTPPSASSLSNAPGVASEGLAAGDEDGGVGCTSAGDDGAAKGPAVATKPAHRVAGAPGGGGGGDGSASNEVGGGESNEGGGSAPSEVSGGVGSAGGGSARAAAGVSGAGASGAGAKPPKYDFSHLSISEVRFVRGHSLPPPPPRLRMHAPPAPPLAARRSRASEPAHAQCLAHLSVARALTPRAQIDEELSSQQANFERDVGRLRKQYERRGRALRAARAAKERESPREIS